MCARIPTFAVAAVVCFQIGPMLFAYPLPQGRCHGLHTRQREDELRDRAETAVEHRSDWLYGHRLIGIAQQRRVQCAGICLFEELESGERQDPAQFCFPVFGTIFPSSLRSRPFLQAVASVHSRRP